MASVQLSAVADRFPVGTTVSVYPRSNWPAIQQTHISGAPVGTATTTAVVQTNGAVTFTGLVPDVRYVAYAQVSGEHRYIGFRVPAGADAGLQYVERITDFSTTLSAEDVPAITITIPPTDEPVWLEAKAVVQNNTAAKWVELEIAETSATASGNAIDLATVDAINGRVSLHPKRRIAASAVERTYKLRLLQQTATNTATLVFTGLGAPAYLTPSVEKA